MATFLSLAAMAASMPPDVPIDSPAPDRAALQHIPWRMGTALSSGVEAAESFLERAAFDRGPWLVVAWIAGIAGWFVLPGPLHWLALIALCLSVALGSAALLARDGRFPLIRHALVLAALAVAAGCALVWTKSQLVGARPIVRPMVSVIEGRLIERREQPAQHRVRLLLATREPGTGRAVRVRLNLDLDDDRAAIAEGARLKLRARLVPPAPPMLPGGYDFARTAWFAGIAATGSVLGPVTVVEPGRSGGWLAQAQRRLAHHVRAQLTGSAGSIAAALASGDRGAIATADEEAMRDAGLTHLLSISGLHVSAVVAAAYFLALRLLGLWPWLALRVRLPLLAAAAGALSGIGYTLLTGAEVPTIRSCIGAVLVLAALALGREPLSMRMVAVAAFLVLLLWPEALVGPSFQMSFAAVIAIVALHGAAPLRAFSAPQERGWIARIGRGLALLLLTGVVIEAALMPIGLFHFHRAGAYGAFANVLAIPLTTFVTMPLIALALLFDLVGLGAPFWWLTGLSLEALLGLARWTASQPGAVTTLPAMGRSAFALFVVGGLWLALWHGRIRLLGLLPAGIGLVLLAGLRPPDLLVSGDGRHVGITGEGSELLMLRASRSDYVRENLTEIAGMNGPVRLLSEWPGARCNDGFCTITLDRGGRRWQVLFAKGKDFSTWRALVAACERVDLVIADRRLPGACRPRWLMADRALLGQTGGLAIDLTKGEVVSVASQQGQHGWWRPDPPRTYPPRTAESGRTP